MWVEIWIVLIYVFKYYVRRLSYVENIEWLCCFY